MRIGHLLGAGRQFSLRSLLVFVAVTALSCAVWRLFGAAGVYVLGFFIVSAIPLMLLSREGKRAFVMSWLAVYGPFAAMAIYTTCCVSCSHCKSTAWTLLPGAPALVPLELARRGMDLPRASDTVGLVSAVAVSATMLAGTARLIRSIPFWWRFVALGTGTACEAWAALAVLAMIRA